jgi:hypothetical protein
MVVSTTVLDVLKGLTLHVVVQAGHTQTGTPAGQEDDLMNDGHSHSAQPVLALLVAMLMILVAIKKQPDDRPVKIRSFP